MEIKSVSGSVLFVLKSAKTVRELVVAAVQLKKNLRGANLCGANLCDVYLRDANLCDANLRGANLVGAYLDGANLDGANLCGAYLDGAFLRDVSLRGAYLDGANLCGAYLRYAKLDGAYLDGKKIHTMRVFSGLYRYEVWAVLFEDGTRFVRMGCLWYSLNEWSKIGIRQSGTREYPDDGSDKYEERVAAFEFAKAAVLRMQLPTGKFTEPTNTVRGEQ